MSLINNDDNIMAIDEDPQGMKYNRMLWRSWARPDELSFYDFLIDLQL